MTHTTFMKTNNVTFWAMLELLQDCKSSEELDQIARHCAQEKGKITEDQWLRVVETGKRQRSSIHLDSVAAHPRPGPVDPQGTGR